MSTKNSFLAFVFGGMLGAAVALLYAPYSGEKTRTVLRDSSEVFKDKAMNSLQEAQARVESFTEEAKRRLEKLEEIAQHTLEEEKHILKESLKQAKEAVGGEGNNGMSGKMYS